MNNNPNHCIKQWADNTKFLLLRCRVDKRSASTQNLSAHVDALRLSTLRISYLGPKDKAWIRKAMVN